MSRTGYQHVSGRDYQGILYSLIKFSAEDLMKKFIGDIPIMT